MYGTGKLPYLRNEKALESPRLVSHFVNCEEKAHKYVKAWISLQLLLLFVPPPPQCSY
jgi:hypothetical protein